MENVDLSNEDFVSEYVKTDTRFYRFFRHIAIFMTKILYRPKYYGLEKIPKEGGLILAPNHVHFPDPGFLIAPNERVIRFLAKKELHEGPLGFLYKAANTIPVDRQGGAHNSLIAAEYVLNQGGVVGVFPEGTRNKKGEQLLLPFKYGAVKMASETGAYIQPVGLITRKGRPFIDPYKVVYGDPYKIEKGADLDLENEKLRNKIIELIS